MDAKIQTTDIEKAFWHYNRSLVSNCTVAVRWEGRVPPEVLSWALDAEAMTHPYLWHFWSEDGQALTPASLPSWSVTWVPPGLDWLDLVEEELHTPLDLTSGPLLRVLARQQDGILTLIVTLPHLISDGVSSYQLTRSVLDRVDRILAGQNLPPPSSDRFLRPRSSDFDPRRAQPSTWTATNEGYHLSAMAPVAEPGGPVGGQPSEPGRSSLRVFRLDREETTAWLDRCRAADVSWNSWLTAALTLTLHRELPIREPSPPIKVASAVDYRPLLGKGLEPRDLGLWAGRIHLWARLERGCGVETLARGFQTGLFHALRRSVYAEMTNFATGKADPGLRRVVPYAKITNHGDLDAYGWSRPFLHGRLLTFQAFTSLHRGWEADWGLGLISSIFQERLHLTLVTRDPGTEAKKADRMLKSIVGSVTI